MAHRWLEKLPAEHHYEKLAKNPCNAPMVIVLTKIYMNVNVHIMISGLFTSLLPHYNVMEYYVIVHAFM